MFARNFRDTDRNEPEWLWSLSFTLLVTVPIVSLIFLFPFIEDNIPQAYIARRLLHGELPYVGTWDQNYPGIIFIHLLSLLFGPAPFGFHLVDFALQIAMIVLLYKVGKLLHSNAAGFFAALLYTLYYVLNGVDDLVGQKDVFASIALVATVWLLLRSEYRSSILAGFFAGIAVLFRPTYGLHCVACVLVIIYASRNAKPVLRFIVGSLVPLGAFSVWYLINGSFAEFWRATFVFTTSVYNRPVQTSLLISPVLYWGVIPVLAFAGLFVIYRTRSVVVTLLIAGMVVSSLISALMMWGYRYHFQPFVAFERLLAGVGIASMLAIANQTIFRGSRRTISISAVCVVAFVIVASVRGTTLSNLAKDMYRSGGLTWENIYHHFEAPAFDPVNETKLADYVESRCAPNDKMESFYTTVYPQYVADLGAANRFILTIPLLMRTASNGFTEMQRNWQQEYTDSMLSVRPRWFLISNPKHREGIGENGKLPREMLHETFPAVEHMIASQYHSDTTIGIWTLYERN